MRRIISDWGEKETLASNHSLSDSKAGERKTKIGEQRERRWRLGVMNWCFISALHAALGKKKRRRVSYEAELVTPWTWRMWHIREQLVRKRCITLGPAARLTTTLALPPLSSELIKLNRPINSSGAWLIWDSEPRQIKIRFPRLTSLNCAVIMFCQNIN